MLETTNLESLGMVGGGGFVSSRVLKELQQGEVYVYAILTHEGAIKIGSTTNLAQRRRDIGFGGTKKLMGFRPGDLALERDIQAAIDEYRIYGTREYYYPTKPVLRKANWMRAYWGIEPLPGRYLPRFAECTFHRRVMEAQARGTSVFI